MIDRPFIWSLKAQFHDVLPAEIKSAIADQFDVPNCKSLVVKFAPQKLILNHDAVAVFVSHWYVGQFIDLSIDRLIDWFLI